MRSTRFSVSLLFILLAGSAGFAANDEQLAAIRELGELNGIALHCKGLEETQRMKRALVLNLPKRRQLGELFDYQTNKAFMRFISSNATCPAGDALSGRVSAAIRELERVYKPR